MERIEAAIHETMTNPGGRLYVYSGPSGVGKGTILAPYLESHPKMVLSCSMTTRAPRPGEIDGVHYHFVTKEAFERAIAENQLLEYVQQYGGDYYGTPRDKVVALLEQGFDVVLEIEVYGAMQIRKTYPDGVFVFLLPPSFDTLRERLTGRDTETPEKVEKRLEKAKMELAGASEYDYVIVNDEIPLAQKRLAAVFDAAKCERRFMQKVLERVCQVK